MPNHETNNVVIIGAPEKIRAFVAEGLRDYEDGDKRWDSERPEKVIDFSLIVPEPENIEQGGCPHAPMDLRPGGAYIDEDGQERVCWCAWNVDNWGTKWNAYSHTHYALRFLETWGTKEVYGRVDLRFETAWNQPTPILRAIEERWGVTVHAVTQDEGGADEVVYGDPYEEGLIRRVVAHEFESYATEVAA